MHVSSARAVSRPIRCLNGIARCIDAGSGGDLPVGLDRKQWGTVVPNRSRQHSTYLVKKLF
jgi:hypothetical protein